jgi:V8-like Glu-specific endopeptidase
MEVTSIAEKLLFATVRIDTSNSQGSGSGTGFIYIQKIGDQFIPVIVSNKHVVNGYTHGSVTFTIKKDGKPKLGNGFRLDIGDFEQSWFGHPSPDIDVAILPLAHLEEHLKSKGVEIFYQAITEDIVPDTEAIKGLDAFEELVFIGYPNGIWDKTNLLPIMRTGTTATPLSIDFEGKPKFLMDASVFPGSSGSPVFIYNPGMYFSKTGTTTVGTRLMFVGVVSAVFFREDTNEIVSAPIPTQNSRPVARSKEMIDLGIVFKAATIQETLNALAKSKGIEA